ncbi:MAG TPA: aminodeoxychorismate lyase [Acidiferrobacterales bacterium]|jgi:4-amino-4-deoxychorismate lyase
MKALVDGRAADSLPLDDRGLHYGDGVFETVAVCAGRPLLWERHLERLRRGCARLGLLAPDAQGLSDELAALCRDAGPRAVVKLIVTRGGGGRGYAPPDDARTRRILLSLPWPDHDPLSAVRGVMVRRCRTTIGRNPLLAGIKHLNRLEQVLARREWRDEFAEGLLSDADGCVIEGTMSNLFLVSRGTLITPDLSQSGVAGVMRAEVLEAARALGIAVAERGVPAAELAAADEMFLTNSLIGLWPVRRLDDRDFPIGELTQTLQKATAGAQCFRQYD